ncbi:flotillin domain-containing protein, partial [Streptomyces xanthophaeus]|uniref:flotillin domain-containing protein n=1 Tax=Streptomyces xanthophaeus TaxID=67385 RepID=UPI0036681B27
EAMNRKAEAFERYGDAAVLQMLVSVLPEVVGKAAEPLAAIDKLTVISTDGASKLSRTVADNVAQGMELLGSTTGVDLAQLLKGLTGTQPAASGAAASGAGASGAAPSGAAPAPSNGKIAITE